MLQCDHAGGRSRPGSSVVQLWLKGWPHFSGPGLRRLVRMPTGFGKIVAPQVRYALSTVSSSPRVSLHVSPMFSLASLYPMNGTDSRAVGGTEAARLTSSYGKSCVNCARSKTRCSYSSNSAICDRCHRLNKDCQLAPTARQKRPSKKPLSINSVASRTAALEEKLDGIVQLLVPTATEPSDTTAFERPTPPISSGGSVVSAPAGYPLESEAECTEYLETFRIKLTPMLPAVCIPSTMTVDQMREQRPFLWLVMRALCTKDYARQHTLGNSIRREIGDVLLIQNVKTLDLLLGILVFTSWTHYFTYGRGNMTVDLQLAVAVAYDLGLNKPAAIPPTMMHYSDQGCPKYSNPPQRTMEERRAIIGLFLLTSVAANYFERIEPLRWTPYLDECLRLLQESKEYSTDELLVCLVRGQRVRNGIATVQLTSCLESPGSCTLHDAYVKLFLSQIDEIKGSLPIYLKSNAMLQLHFLNTVVSIHEHSLIPSKQTSLDPGATTDRIQNLHSCFSAVKTWFTVFFTLDEFPLSCYPYISMITHSQAAHCMVALFRLTTFESPGIPWDRQRVRREFDFGQVIRTWLERWEGAPAAAGLDASVWSNVDGPPWAATRKYLSAIINWWEAKIAPRLVTEVNGMRVQDDTASIVRTMYTDGSQLEPVEHADQNLEFLDDEWMRDVLGPGYDFFREPYG
ncbi:hypothetical protein NA57DRAFT_50533 [Rhizodiscina lignyota]|uniref:Zn(2)-C6 fungal-type domain-containing protein n=1 Tax=Rhizodiscina lignyota TaxID=1504668 RepID=A0A9P4MAG7_9PEZI|nr:hypothetical protein NA57DRAFT_50533 [Rhizodiscina lignyota]